MHPNSMRLMEEFLKKYLPKNKVLDILDVGSMDVNGCYKHLLAGHNYKGLDLEAGKNVDIVEPVPYDWKGVPDASYDVIISGQCLEHVPAPWKWIREISRVAKPNALIIILAPWSWDPHYYPVDCWRVLPDGMTELLSYAGIRVVEVGMDKADCIGIGLKI